MGSVPKMRCRNFGESEASRGRQVVTILWGLRELHFWRRFGENLQIGRNGGVDAGRAQRFKSTSYSSVLKILLILSKPSAVRWSIHRLMSQTSADGFWYCKMGKLLEIKEILLENEVFLEPGPRIFQSRTERAWISSILWSMSGAAARLTGRIWRMRRKTPGVSGNPTAYSTII